MKPTGQNAVEFLSVYAFAIIIVTVAIALVLILSSSGTSVIPAQCSFTGSFSCTDAIYATWNGMGSQLFLEATFTQPGQANVSSFNVIIDSFVGTNAICTPNVASEGETVYCTASFSYLPTVGGTYSGTFSISSNYCAGPTSSLYNYSCPANDNYTYTGTLQLQAESQQLPNGPYYYLPFTVTNTNTTNATEPGLQVMVAFAPDSLSQYETSNLGNIRFYDGAKELYSWCETGCKSATSTNAVFWVALDRGVAPGGTIPLSAYFLPNTITYDGFYAGESPLQSNTYAQYDNGAQVFNFYDNFAGSVLNSSKWNNQCALQGSTCTVDNGITITTASTGTGAAIYSKSSFSSGVVDFYYVQTSSDESGNQCLMGAGLSNSSSPEVDSALAGSICGEEFQTSNYLGEVNRISNFVSGATILESIAIPSSSPSIITQSVNYTHVVYSTSNLPSLPQPIVLLTQSSVTVTPGFEVRYIRVRDDPPGGVLPTATKGSVTQVP